MSDPDKVAAVATREVINIIAQQINDRRFWWKNPPTKHTHRRVFYFGFNATSHNPSDQNVAAALIVEVLQESLPMVVDGFEDAETNRRLVNVDLLLHDKFEEETQREFSWWQDQNGFLLSGEHKFSRYLPTATYVGDIFGGFGANGIKNMRHFVRSEFGWRKVTDQGKITIEPIAQILLMNYNEARPIATRAQVIDRVAKKPETP